MQQSTTIQRGPVVVERADFGRLFDILRDHGYCVIGPTIRDNSIIYDTLESVDNLPIGYTDIQESGVYRLQRRMDDALFGYTVGPQSWKKYLHPSRLRLWQADRTPVGIHVTQEPHNAQKYAFLGVRACEIEAIAIQDTVFLGGTYVDSAYQTRREHICVIAVNCGEAGGTCFCTSMQTGPKVTHGYDLNLTEILDEGRHYFLMESGSDLGDALLADLPHRPADEADVQISERIIAATAASMGRHMDTAGVADVLRQNLEHPNWDIVADRCLACGNCTMVCPTCFCVGMEEHTDLSGAHTERWRRWDSCFTVEYSHIAGGSIRPSTKSRYRQWLTHKLATWQEQFGASGCVGCGRCITWCPAKIDITEEVRAMQTSANAPVVELQEEKI